MAVYAQVAADLESYDDNDIRCVSGSLRRSLMAWPRAGRFGVTIEESLSKDIRAPAAVAHWSSGLLADQARGAGIY